MQSYYNVQSFGHKTYDKTKAKPAYLAKQFSTLTSNITNFSNSVRQYADDWGQVGNQLSSSDWADYANNIGDTAANISSALADAGKRLMEDLDRLVTDMKGLNAKQTQQLSEAKGQMTGHLAILEGLK